MALSNSPVKVSRVTRRTSLNVFASDAIDPDGHALELYYYMEQVGWDGRPRPADLRRRVDNANWPDTLDPMEDSFLGEAFLGPWG